MKGRNKKKMERKTGEVFGSLSFVQNGCKLVVLAIFEEKHQKMIKKARSFSLVGVYLTVIR